MTSTTERTMGIQGIDHEPGPSRGLRVPDGVWHPALARAKREKPYLSWTITAFLEAYNRVSPEDWAALHRIADERGLKFSQILVEAMHDYAAVRDESAGE